MRTDCTSNLTVLQTREDRIRAANLSAYIWTARKSAKVLTINWDNPYWNGIGYFVTQAHAPRGSLVRDVPAEAWLAPALIDFAKAYITEQHLTNPGESRAGHTKRLQMLRMLELSLLKHRDRVSPLEIDLCVLDAAAEFAKQYLDGYGPNRVGAELCNLAKVLVRHEIAPELLAHWSNPNAQPRHTSSGIGPDAERARQKRLPNGAALTALAEIFNTNLEPGDEHWHKDIFTTSAIALLTCAPSRGEEILQLPDNLEFEATDRFGEEQLGLRVHAGKGFGAYVKWVWSGMLPVAETAIERIKVMTEEARRLARHYEDPATCGRFYRHPDCPDVLDDEPLTPTQMCKALGLAAATPKHALTRMANEALHQSKGPYTLRRLWDEYVLPRHRQLHPYFPYISAKAKALGDKGGLKYSEALFCMLRHQFNPRSGTSPVMLWLPDLSDLNFDLGGRRNNIFTRYQYTDSDGALLKLNSNQIRHLLNTEAQRTGLSDEQIAHWSGRLRVAQNSVYDHRTVSERVEQARDVTETTASALALVSTIEPPDERKTETYGPWVVKFMRKPVASDIDDVQPHLTALRTLYGECHHEWESMPCEGFVHCLDCSAHSCIKGDDTVNVLARLDALYESTNLEIERARRASEENVAALDWLQVQERYAAKLKQLTTILRSDTVPDGSRIRSAEEQHPTHLHRAVRGLAQKALENGTESAPVMRQTMLAIEHGLTSSKNG